MSDIKINVHIFLRYAKVFRSNSREMVLKLSHKQRSSLRRNDSCFSPIACSRFRPNYRPTSSSGSIRLVNIRRRASRDSPCPNCIDDHRKRLCYKWKYRINIWNFLTQFKKRYRVLQTVQCWTITDCYSSGTDAILTNYWPGTG